MSDPSVDWAFIARVLERYPDVAYLAKEPEILNLLVAATKEEWSPEVLQGRLQQTAYWRTRAPAVRAWEQLEANDPAGAVVKVNDTKQKIAALATQYGGTFDEAAFGDMWWRVNREGWTDQQLRMAVANVVQPGAAQQVDVNALADQYMLDIGDDEAADYTRRLFTGEIDENTLRNVFSTRATVKFPTFAEQMKGGAVPADFFADYRTMIGRYTDTPTAAVDLIRDPEWAQILSYTDPAAGGALRPMTISEATKHVRGTSRYQTSTVGKAETAEFTDAITKALGTRR